MCGSATERHNYGSMRLEAGRQPGTLLLQTRQHATRLAVGWLCRPGRSGLLSDGAEGAARRPACTRIHLTPTLTGA